MRSGASTSAGPDRIWKSTQRSRESSIWCAPIPASSSLVFPQTVRQILQHILIIEGIDDLEAANDWQRDWLNSATDRTPDGAPLPEGGDEDSTGREAGLGRYCCEFLCADPQGARSVRARARRWDPRT